MIRGTREHFSNFTIVVVVAHLYLFKHELWSQNEEKKKQRKLVHCHVLLNSAPPDSSAPLLVIF